MHRCQVAVMMVDIVGYARMVSANEERAVQRMLLLRSETIEPLASIHRGHVVDYAGDGALLSFAASDLAMECAVDIQRQLTAIEKDKHFCWRVQLRIGIDAGSVIVTDTGIAGQHVNIAARLETLAEAGEICLSKNAYRALSDRNRQACRFRGTTKLKHIDRPIDVWSWLPRLAPIALPPNRPTMAGYWLPSRPLAEPDRAWEQQSSRPH